MLLYSLEKLVSQFSLLFTVSLCSVLRIVLGNGLYLILTSLVIGKAFKGLQVKMALYLGRSCLVHCGSPLPKENKLK